MSDPEPDELFRKRLLRVVSEKDRPSALVVRGPYLDSLGRKYGRFRTGVPLKGFDSLKDNGSKNVASEEDHW